MNRNIVGQHDEFAGWCQSLARAQDHGIGSRRRVIRCGRVDPQPINNTESRGLPQIGLTLKEVVLLALQISRGEKPPVEPVRPGSLAVKDKRTVVLRRQHIGLCERDPRIALGVVRHDLLLKIEPPS